MDVLDENGHFVSVLQHRQLQGLSGLGRRSDGVRLAPEPSRLALDQLDELLGHGGVVRLGHLLVFARVFDVAGGEAEPVITVARKVRAAQSGARIVGAARERVSEPRSCTP